MQQHFIRFWLQRSSSERKLLLGWAVIMTATLFYFAVAAPLSSRLQRLARSIPQLEAQHLAMRAQPPRTSARPATGIAPSTDLRSAVFEFLSQQQLSADVRSLSATRVELRLPALPSERALTLLQQVREQSSAHVVVISLKPGTSAGTVQVVAEMERQP